MLALFMELIHTDCRQDNRPGLRFHTPGTNDQLINFLSPVVPIANEHHDHRTIDSFFGLTLVRDSRTHYIRIRT